MIYGPDIALVKERAKEQVMWKFVEGAEADGTPPTLRALYVLKAQQAEAVLAGGSSDMIEQEADLRGVTAMQMAGVISAMATASSDMEIQRMTVNVAIEKATSESAIAAILASLNLTLAMRNDTVSQPTIP